MGKKISKDQLSKINQLIKMGLNNKEIAVRLNTTREAIAITANRFLGGNPNYRLKKTKHKHLREKALAYFMTHTMEETRKHLKLTEAELKSCLSVAYSDPRFTHLRKDSRRHEAWSERELLFMLKYCGVISRDEINNTIKRGNSGRVIKEKLRSLGVCSKNLNGMTLSQFRKIWGIEPEFHLATTAGPSSGGKNGTCFKIIPWAYVDELINNKIIDHEDCFTKYVSTMAMFQKWIHGENYWHSLTHIKF